MSQFLIGRDRFFPLSDWFFPVCDRKLGRLIFPPFDMEIWRALPLALAFDFCNPISNFFLLFHTAKSMYALFSWIVYHSMWDCIRISTRNGNYLCWVPGSGRAKRPSRAREQAREDSSTVFWVIRNVSRWETLLGKWLESHVLSNSFVISCLTDSDPACVTREWCKGASEQESGLLYFSLYFAFILK